LSNALLAIARNAIALLDDAEFLFQNGRYPRATALAVLAGEEAGKFWLMKWKPTGWESHFYQHGPKLAVTAAFHQAEAAGVLMGSTGDLVETYRTAPSAPDHEQWAQRARAFAPIKMAALYVDVDDCAVREPHTIGQETTAKCLECHQYGEEHSNFQRSAHSTNGVSCTDCHSPHHAKEAQFLLASAQPTLCYTCHLDVKPEFSKPFHHRVNENLVKCTDCHNQHGGFLTKQLRSTAAQDAVCFTCHVDKAGPFVFEHAAVKIEGCVACHVPHGSANPRMLVRSQVNTLCLECHTLTLDSSVPGAPSFHNQAQKYQACTLCHAQLHGSNFDPNFFK